MKIVVRISDVVALANRLEESPKLAMRGVVDEMRSGVKDVLDRVMAAELEPFLGREEEAGKKKNRSCRARSGSRAWVRCSCVYLAPSRQVLE